MPDSLGALRLMVGPEAPASLRAVYGDHQLSEPLVGAAAAAWINPASCFEPSEPPPPPPPLADDGPGAARPIRSGLLLGSRLPPDDRQAARASSRTAAG